MGTQNALGSWGWREGAAGRSPDQISSHGNALNPEEPERSTTFSELATTSWLLVIACPPPELSMVYGFAALGLVFLVYASGIKDSWVFVVVV